LSFGVNGVAVAIGAGGGGGGAIVVSFFEPQLDKSNTVRVAKIGNLFTGCPFDWCIFSVKLHCIG